MSNRFWFGILEFKLFKYNGGYEQEEKTEF